MTKSIKQASDKLKIFCNPGQTSWTPPHPQCNVEFYPSNCAAMFQQFICYSERVQKIEQWLSLWALFFCVPRTNLFRVVSLKFYSHIASLYQEDSIKRRVLVLVN